jgi:hypothetical protein
LSTAFGVVLLQLQLQMDFLEHPAITDVVVCRTVVEEVGRLQAAAAAAVAAALTAAAAAAAADCQPWVLHGGSWCVK